MGMDHDVSLCIGCLVTAESFDSHKKKTKRRFRMEKRFDPKTGKQLPDQKVITHEGGTCIVFNGEEYSVDDDGVIDDAWALYDAIATEIGCRVHTGMNADGDSYAVFTTNAAIGDGTSAPLKIPAARIKELERIHKALQKLEIETWEPKIYAVQDVY